MAVTGKWFLSYVFSFGSIPDIAVNDYKNKSEISFLINTQGCSRLVVRT